MDKKAYKQMMEQVVPSEALVRKTKINMSAHISNQTNSKIIKEEPILRKRYFRTAAVVAITIMLFTITAFAAWYFLKPSEVAEEVGDYSLSAAFESETAVNINQSATSGDYTFTLLGIASGKDISDMPFYSDGELKNDRTYTVLAIQKADGLPIDRQSDEYFNASFFVSPLIKGANPALVNIMSMNGAFSETVTDGVIYRIIECDNIEMFADRGLYLAVSSGGSFYNWDAFIWNEQSGEITTNPNFVGASAVFDLPIDIKLADPMRAELYLNDLLLKPDANYDVSNPQNNIDDEVSEPPALLPIN